MLYVVSFRSFASNFRRVVGQYKTLKDQVQICFRAIVLVIKVIYGEALLPGGAQNDVDVNIVARSLLTSRLSV